MTNGEMVTRSITESYLKMELEKKTGKYGHEIVKVVFLCHPEHFNEFRAKALEELKDSLNLLTQLQEAEG